ncbi:hypothetical protein B7P43_G03303 [Cryptotermes secundus]|uniref:Tc1-like transposase DDE domain-containing protein n=1 Tax=Cryptotermes secundus TaxID=105785 RepID=A0A2J7PIE9_9NEOP|nr:hypothetical protein B7P43_G03303 [Cryptotermes secundus]
MKLGKSATETLEILREAFGEHSLRRTLVFTRSFIIHVPETPELVTNNMVIVPQPIYSPDLAPCDFALFPKMKIKLKGRRFERVFDIQRESKVVLENIKEDDFHGTLEARKKRWDSCIRSRASFKEMEAKIKLSRRFFLDLVQRHSVRSINIDRPKAKTGGKLMTGMRQITEQRLFS